MDIRFFDDPMETPRPREEVRIQQMGLFVYEDGRRVAVGFDLTPFLERPSLEITVINANGQPAGSMTVIETMEANFTLTLHLRDKEPTEKYELTADLYYAAPDEDRLDVHRMSASFDVTQPGEQLT